jgi:hypothetical protein
MDLIKFCVGENIKIYVHSVASKQNLVLKFIFECFL